jgi:hypothetical protein
MIRRQRPRTASNESHGNLRVSAWRLEKRPGLALGSTCLEFPSSTTEVPPPNGELSEVQAGTRVILTQRALPEVEWDAHHHGWRHYLPRLAKAAAGEDPGPDQGPDRSS